MYILCRMDKHEVFLDGTWLYYSVYKDLKIDHKLQRVDWGKIPQIIGLNIQNQLMNGNAVSKRPVEVWKTSVFTSLKENTSKSSARASMVEDFHSMNFDVHR